MIKQRKKSRYHQVLFDDDMPFKGRREAPKKAYVRKPKHKGKELSNALPF